jgi:hypothetical protein
MPSSPVATPTCSRSRTRAARTGTVIGAVATGYNVQALHVREAELTAFAGIVAHDLDVAPAVNASVLVSTIWAVDAGKRSHRAGIGDGDCAMMSVRAPAACLPRSDHHRRHVAACYPVATG